MYNMFGSLGRTAASVLGGSGGTSGAMGANAPSNNSNNNGNNYSTSFTTDDFPALGGPAIGGGGGGAAGSAGAPGSGPAGSGGSAPTSSLAANLGLPPGTGMGVLGSNAGGGAAAASLLGGGAGGPSAADLSGSNGAAEQASALAALQHQHAAREQHRQALLGSVNTHSSSSNTGGNTGGSASTAATSTANGLNAAKGGFGEPERNYVTKLGGGGAPGGAPAHFAWLGGGGAGAAGGVGSLPPGILPGNTHLSGSGLNGSSPGQPANADPATMVALQQQRAAAVAAVQAGSSPHEAALAAAHAAALAQAQQQHHHQQQQQQGLDGGAAASGINTNPTGEVASSPAQQVLLSPADRFGLVGLLSIIKMQDPDLSMLALGADLSKLGLNMNSTEPLSSAFLTPWSELADANGAVGAGSASTRGAGGTGATGTDPSAPVTIVEPEFHLPSCYNVQPPPPAQSKTQNFSDETLFFIFHSTPRDLLQEMAAQELYNRNWRYHKDLHLWLTKEQNTEPTQKTPQYERGNYIFFDPGRWEKITKSEYLALLYHL